MDKAQRSERQVCKGQRRRRMAQGQITGRAPSAAPPSRVTPRSGGDSGNPSSGQTSPSCRGSRTWERPNFKAQISPSTSLALPSLNGNLPTKFFFLFSFSQSFFLLAHALALTQPPPCPRCFGAAAVLVEELPKPVFWGEISVSAGGAAEPARERNTSIALQGSVCLQARCPFFQACLQAMAQQRASVTCPATGKAEKWRGWQLERWFG